MSCASQYIPLTGTSSTRGSVLSDLHGLTGLCCAPLPGSGSAHPDARHSHFKNTIQMINNT